MNEWQLVSSRPLGFFTPTGGPAAAFHGGTGLTGPFHTTSGTFRSNVQGETVFVTWNLCPSGMNAYSSSLPIFLMKDIGWDPIKDMPCVNVFSSFYKICCSFFILK
jgi:hypothetical protein